MQKSTLTEEEAKRAAEEYMHELEIKELMKEDDENVPGWHS